MPSSQGLQAEWAGLGWQCVLHAEHDDGKWLLDKAASHLTKPSPTASERKNPANLVCNRVLRGLGMSLIVEATEEEELVRARLAIRCSQRLLASQYVNKP